MHSNLAIPTSVLYGFLLVLARISGVFVFLPLPGLQAGPSAAKITLAMILTFGMYSRAQFPGSGGSGAMGYSSTRTTSIIIVITSSGISTAII